MATFLFKHLALGTEEVRHETNLPPWLSYNKSRELRGRVLGLKIGEITESDFYLIRRTA